MHSPNRGLIATLRKPDASGKHRPILIVSPKFLNAGLYLTAVPFTSAQIEKRKTLRTCVFFAAGEFGLDKDCVAKTDDVSQFKISELNLSSPRASRRRPNGGNLGGIVRSFGN